MEIKEKLPEIQENIPLAKHTTFKIGGPAKYFYIAKKQKDLVRVIKTAKELKLPFLILGGGSNVLFSDKGYNGLVIKIQTSKIVISNSEIFAEAGALLDKIVRLSLEKSLTGLEWAAGVPGTIGGAVYGNAGAFGSVIGDMVKTVKVLDINNLKIKKFSFKDCRFSSKNSIFKKKKNLIILSVILGLKRGDKKEIQKKIKERLNYRKKNHPLNFPSAGCAFKNQKSKIKNQKLLKIFPQIKEFNKRGMIPASYLIDKCGLKGKKLGKAKISEKHANFIINLGGAKTKDVLKLIKLAKQKVKNKFGVRLEEEIIVINT